MDHILTITASVGVRSKELDTAQSTSEDLGLRYDEDIARLQDLDYAKALSDLAQKQFSLEAAQKTYVAVTSMKLFDFIK
jgi:flagellar hook-associated protein 3 FlgL